MTKIKLRSLEFFPNGMRKLKNIKLEFAERFTIIAGYNGIGKSTILGLIASASGLPKEDSYFDKPFSIDINHIIHFDPDELETEKLSPPWPKATYVNLDTEKEHWKNIRLTKRPEKRLRSVASTAADSPDNDLSLSDGKVPLPTIYLGLLRVLPVGETLEAHVQSEFEESLDEDDKDCIIKFINDVMSGSTNKKVKDFTGLSVKYTNKRTKHPTYAHSSKSVSLGQDSLSSIATAIASFNKLKREMGEDYPGGLLIIDEIDAGFHPKAQQQLFEALCSQAKKLSLQIIATTHSPRMVELTHPDSNFKKSEQRNAQYLDKIIYLADSRNPEPVDWPLNTILEDMSLSPLTTESEVKPEKVKIYLEDEEAAFFLKGILGMKRDYKSLESIPFQIFPLGIGGTNLLKLPKFDPHFEKVILLVDADTTVPDTRKNGLKLPSPKDEVKSPENILYSYIEHLVNNDTAQYSATYKALKRRGITSDRLTEDFLNTHSGTDREARKKWFKSNYKKIEEYEILTFWTNDHAEEVNKFKKELVNKLNELKQNKN